MRGVSTTLGGRRVHQGIDLCVARGELLALVGGSGSGKTTLMRVMMDLLTPDAGEVRVLGQDLGELGVLDRARVMRRVGVLFQGGALFSALTVHDNVAAPMLELRHLDRDIVGRLVGVLLDMVGLPPRAAGQMPAELSGGMVRRAGLARALALEPELLFLDEPTAGLDPGSSAAFVELISRLKAELGLTVVLISHDSATVSALSDRVAVLADAAVAVCGPLPEVQRSDHPFARAMFGAAGGDGFVHKTRADNGHKTRADNDHRGPGTRGEGQRP